MPPFFTILINIHNLKSPDAKRLSVIVIDTFFQQMSSTKCLPELLFIRAIALLCIKPEWAHPILSNDLSRVVLHNVLFLREYSKKTFKSTSYLLIRSYADSRGVRIRVRTDNFISRIVTSGAKFNRKYIFTQKWE